MLRTGKETVKRRATLDQYSAEIDDLLYADIEKVWAMPDAGAGEIVDLNNQSALIEIIQKSLVIIANLDQLDPHDDFFERGIDSLQVLRLVRDLRSRYGVGQLQPATNYLASSAASLAKAISDLSNDSRQSKEK